MTLGQDKGYGGRPHARGIALAHVWPEIVTRIPPEDRALAGRVLVAPLLESATAELSELMQTAAATAFDFVVVEGVVLKETVFAARSALELLGRGDVLAPPLTATRQLESPATSRYIAHDRVSIAVLDDRFRQAARRWSGLSDALHDRLAQQTHRASMHLAMLHLVRAEDRIMALFVDLAHRFGRMTTDGAIVDFELTHELIGRLVGARRPTVSLALSVLASAEALTRLDDGGWRIAADAMTS